MMIGVHFMLTCKLFFFLTDGLGLNTKPTSFASQDMFCRFAAIGVGHEIQYPMQPTSSDNEMDEGDELDLGDNEDNCPTATQVNSGRGMDDSVASPASNGWNSDENNDEEFERDEDDEDEDEDDLEDGGDMGDDDSEDVRY